MEEILINIANVGFPIAVSVYLLVRMEEKLEGLTASIDKLSKAILKLS